MTPPPSCVPHIATIRPKLFGLLDGRAIDSSEVATLATLPSLDQIRAKLVGLIHAPAQKIVTVLGAPAGQLARVIEARRAAMKESGDEA